MTAPTLDDIRDYNPWMHGKKFEVPAFKRQQYKAVFGALGKKKFIIAITGLRRVGKTVMLKQMGNELRVDKYFFSFEEDRFANYNSLKHVIDQFVKWSEKPVIFLDEIARIEGWAGALKKYHDLGKAIFVISGSSALHITKGKESLAGRLVEFVLPPWRFSEYLALKGHKVETYQLKDIEKAYLKWNHRFEDEIKPFMKKGSFPELVNENNEEFIKKYIRTTTIDKIIFEDIPKTFAIKKTSLLDDILSYVCKNTGNIIHLSHLGNAFDVSKDTIKEYLYYLKYAYLLELLPTEGSPLKSFRKPKKAYAISPSVAYGLMDSYNESMLVENAVFNKLKTETNKLYFYRDSQQHEVDFTGTIVVESKWKSTITRSDLRSLMYYMEKKHIPQAYVVGKTFDVIQHNKSTIYIIPLPLFLLSNLQRTAALG